MKPEGIREYIPQPDFTYVYLEGTRKAARLVIRRGRVLALEVSHGLRNSEQLFPVQWAELVEAYARLPGLAAFDATVEIQRAIEWVEKNDPQTFAMVNAR